MANSFGNSVSAWSIAAGTGTRTALNGSPFPTGSYPAGVATDPTGKLAYVANNGNATVSAYSIDPKTGALTAVDGSPFPAGARPQAVAIAAIQGP